MFHDISSVFREQWNLTIDETKTDSTFDKVSDDSFARLEKICENFSSSEGGCGELLDEIDVPKLNDTLEEVDFILSLGMQLKSEGKINFPTPPIYHFGFRVPALNVTKASFATKNCASTPKSSRSNLMPKLVCRNRLSSLFTPIPFRCNSNISSSVNIEHKYYIKHWIFSIFQINQISPRIIK